MFMFVVTLILLAILFDFMLGMVIGRLIPLGGGWTGTFTAVLSVISGFFTVFSILDLVAMGILTVWPSAFLFGLASGWNRGCQRKSRLA